MTLSANSQVARFKSGASSVDQLPIWELQHDWGRSGQARIAELSEISDHPEQDDLELRIKAARDKPNKYQFRSVVNGREKRQTAQQLADLLVARPVGTAPDVKTLETMQIHQLKSWLKGCRQETDQGQAGCVFVSGQFRPLVGSELGGVLLFLGQSAKLRATFLNVPSDGKLSTRSVISPRTGKSPVLSAGLIAKALDGAFDIRPSGLNALFIGETALMPRY